MNDATEAVQRSIDETFFAPMKPAKPPDPPPKAFPARALRDKPGEAPLIEREDG